MNKVIGLLIIETGAAALQILAYVPKLCRKLLCVTVCDGGATRRPGSMGYGRSTAAHLGGRAWSQGADGLTGACEGRHPENTQGGAQRLAASARRPVGSCCWRRGLSSARSLPLRCPRSPGVCPNGVPWAACLLQNPLNDGVVAGGRRQ